MVRSFEEIKYPRVMSMEVEHPRGPSSPSST